MKHLFSASAYLFIIFLVSCNGQSDNKEKLVAPTVLPATTDPVSVGNSDSLPAGVTLNPKHGEPGHRCELAVGAPLNAPTTIDTTKKAAITPNPVIVPSDAPKVAPESKGAAAAGLNPKHGEPGHRCDIAVGAPLNSKPTQ
jgi:hypothetical protein